MLVFLDFEASSLNKQSYPIEVGWVFEDGTGESHLIRPAAGWTDWDDEAEAMHGISLAQLASEGKPVGAVCERVVGLFEGNTVLASAPSWDGHWLSMLLRAAGKPRHLVRLRDSEEAFIEAAHRGLDPAADPGAIAGLIAEARTIVEAAPTEHRALADARREREIWLTVRELARQSRTKPN